MRKSRSDRMNRRILSALIGVPSRRPRLIRRLVALFPAIFAGFLLASGAPSLAGQTDGELERRARAIHDNVLTLDTHVDINASNFTAERNYTQRLDTQVNLPLMTEGGLDAAFFIVYVGQSSEARSPDAFAAAGYDRAYQQAIAKFEAIDRLTKELAPNQIGLALTAADVRRIAASGKKVVLIGVENGYPLGDQLDRVKEFYDLGARYLSLAHNGHSQLSDSNTGERTGFKWNGLSPRNLDDEQLLALKKNGGVVQLVALSTYVKTPKPDSPERAAAVAALRKELGLPEPPVGSTRGGGSDFAQFSDAQRVEYRTRIAALNKVFPPDPPATVAEFVNHIDYVVKKIGVDHAGIASDFDGGGGINGWNHAGETFNVTLELVRRGYTEKQIAKIWSGNLLRVMAQVEKVAKELRYQPRTFAKISGATIVASDSMMYLGVSIPSFPHVIFSLGTAPE
jgi:membrane dipeptidase